MYMTICTNDVKLTSPSLMCYSPGVVTECNDIVWVCGGWGVGSCHHFHQRAWQLLSIHQVLTLKNHQSQVKGYQFVVGATCYIFLTLSTILICIPLLAFHSYISQFRHASAIWNNNYQRFFLDS